MGIRRNVAANLLGKAWVGAMNFVFVPVYLKFLGIEAYGLVGFFTTLMALAMLFDMGVSTTVNRELARLETLPSAAASTRDLLRSLEWLYWLLGAMLGALLLLCSTWLARSWLTTQSLAVAQAARAIQLMGVVVMLRWPMTLYVGGLMGLHRQVLANVVGIVATTAQTAGVALVLWLLSPSIVAFFEWQIAVALLQAAVLPALLWSCMPKANRAARFSGAALRRVWRFSAGVAGITVCTVILNQADKFLLSKFLPLPKFGFYVLASSIAASLSLIAMAVHSAMFPAFSRLSAGGRTQELIGLYHRSCQALSVLLLPIAALLFFFSKALLSYYVRDADIVLHTYQVLSLLAVGYALLAVVGMPLMLQLAHGWTRLSLYKNLLAVTLFLPLLWCMIERFGAVGAAATWIALPLAYLLVEVPIMHRRLLPSEMRKWYLMDVGLPALLSVICVGGARALLGSADNPWLVAPVMAAAALLALGTSALILFKSGDLRYSNA